MVMSVSIIDRIQFEERKGVYVDRLIETDFVSSALFFKFLVSTLEELDPIMRQWNDSIFEDTEVFKQHFKILIEVIIKEELNRKEKEKKDKLSELYSTSDLAKFVGVTQQTINNWIKDERIVGVTREGRSHAKIPDDAEVIYPNGVRILVSELKAAWEKENIEPVTDEISYLKYCVSELQLKYGDVFEKTLGAKTLLELTSEEETDATMWKSYLKRLNGAEASNSNT